MLATLFVHETHSNVRLSEEKLTFLKMPASFFVRETYSTVKQSKWKNDFFQNASYPFRSKNSLEHASEYVKK